MQPSFSDVDIVTKPITCHNAQAMLKKAIDPNERPYIQMTLKNNNQLVDEWYQKVLRNICDSTSSIPAGLVWHEWQVFYTGKIIGKFIDHLNKGLVMRPSVESIEYWTSILTTQSVKELVKLGAPLVGYGWKLIIDETYIRSSVDKWEKIYSQSDDPLDWRKLANDYPKLWNTDGESPFWAPEQATEVKTKVMTIMSNPVKPD